MRLDWSLIRTILAHVEAETIKEFLQDMDSLSIWGEGKSPWERLDEKQKALKTVLGHFEILLDAGILKNGQVTRRSDGSSLKRQYPSQFNRHLKMFLKMNLFIFSRSIAILTWLLNNSAGLTSHFPSGV